MHSLATHYAPSSKRGSKSAYEASRRVKSYVVNMDGGMSSEQGKLFMVLAATNIPLM